MNEMNANEHTKKLIKQKRNEQHTALPCIALHCAACLEDEIGRRGK